MKRKGKSMKQKNDLVDRISDLPDSILGLILSHLPAKEAVATSILSKRWRFGWVTIHNLDLSCYFVGENDTIEFIRFVNRVFLLHENDFIIKFCLEWRPDCVSSQVTSWIDTLITKHVKELTLCLAFRELRDSITCFNFVSLLSLKLDGYIFISAATVFCLPKLERLQLFQVDFESEETFEKLINGCSVLHDLCIHTDEDAEDFTDIIFSTSLRRLTYYSHRNLKLEASSLEYLHVDCDNCRISVPKNLTSLVEADIKIHQEFFEEFSDEFSEEFSDNDECNPANSVVELVRASNSAKFLTLSHNVVEALRCATISLSTEFRRLVKLKTDIECCPWSSLRDLIQNSDNLEDLTVCQSVCSYGGTDHGHHTKWTTPVEVPRCLSNSLKRVHISGYEGMEDEYRTILYMLEHGSVLQVMKVSCNGNFFVGGDPKKIEDSPKKSSACKVEVIIKSSAGRNLRDLYYDDGFEGPSVWF